MKRIETSYGSIYVEEAGDPPDAFDRAQSHDIEAELGEDLWTNPDAYKVSGPKCAFFVVIALSVGFGIGSYFHDSSSTRITLIIVLCALLLAIRAFRNMHLQHESAYLEMLAENRHAEHALLDKRLKADAQTNKQLNAAIKLQGKNKDKHAFTSDDFDDKARALLLKPVNEARKAKAKVTGEGLLKTILKSIR